MTKKEMTRVYSQYTSASDFQRVRVIYPTRWGVRLFNVLVLVAWGGLALAWTSALWLAPLILGVLQVTSKMRVYLMALRWVISIPEEWRHTEQEPFMIQHQAVRIKYQREMGLVRFALAWRDPDVHVKIASEAYAYDVAMRLRTGGGHHLRNTWTRHYAGAIKMDDRVVRRSGWTVSRIEVEMAGHVSAALAMLGKRDER